MATRDLRAEVVAELRRERYGTVTWAEAYRSPLPLALDTPAAWLRRRAVLLDALEGIPQDYRRGCPQASTGSSTVKRGRETTAVHRMVAA